MFSFCPFKNGLERKTPTKHYVQDMTKILNGVVFFCDVLVFGAHGLNLKSLTHKMKIFELHHAGFWSYPARSVLWVTLIPLHARTLGGNVHSCTELLNMLNIWPRCHNVRILALKTPPHTGGTVTSETLLS